MDTYLIVHLLENSSDSYIPNTKIVSAAFSDMLGKRKLFSHRRLLLFFGENAEKQLLQDINQEIAKYRYSFGWNSTSVLKYNKTKRRIEGIDSDLSILHSRCLANGVYSLVGFDKAGIPYKLREENMHTLTFIIYLESK